MCLHPHLSYERNMRLCRESTSFCHTRQYPWHSLNTPLCWLPLAVHGCQPLQRCCELPGFPPCQGKHCASWGGGQAIYIYINIIFDLFIGFLYRNWVVQRHLSSERVLFAAPLSSLLLLLLSFEEIEWVAERDAPTVLPTSGGLCLPWSGEWKGHPTPMIRKRKAASCCPVHLGSLKGTHTLPLHQSS